MKADIAKQLVSDKIIQSFGDAFIGVSDKKIYVEMRDADGSVQQVAIALTCPKTPLSKDTPAVSESVKSEPTPAQFNEESDNIKKLMESLNLL